MKLLKKVIIGIILLCLIIGIIVVGNGYMMYKEAIEEVPLSTLVEEIKSKQNYTEINELPKIYIDAVIAVEDHRFYKHNGIDVIAIGRAIINDIKAMRFVEGGSTITQQLSKNTYFTQEKKLTRKVAEVFMALEIEKNYDKDEILELYLNTSYFGDGYYGIEEACNGYLDKSAKDMSLYEATMMAGIPNAPSVYAPTANLDLTLSRQQKVISTMVENNYITQEEADNLLLMQH